MRLHRLDEIIVEVHEDPDLQVLVLRGRGNTFCSGFDLDELLAEHTGQPVEKIHRDTDRDFVMGAAEAKEYGLIDEVISSRSAADMSGPITRAS